MQRPSIPNLAHTLITPIHAKACARFLWLLIVTPLLAALVLPRPSAEAHEVAVTLDGLESLTETLLPVFVDDHFYGKDRALLEALPPELFDALCYSVPEVSGQFMAQKPELDCQPVYDLAQGQEPDLDYDRKVTGWQCKETGKVTEPWQARFHCRDWSAVYAINTYLPVDRHTFEASLDDNGGVHIDLDLSDANATVTLLLVGERVDSTGCHVVHPFEETAIYAVGINIDGLSGSVDATLASDDNSTIYIKSINTDTLTLALDKGAVEFNTVTKDKVDEVLLGALSVLPAGSPAIYSLASLDVLLGGVDIVNMLADLGAFIYGWKWGDGCANTEDCLIEIAQEVLAKNIDSLIGDLNTAIATPLMLPADVRNVSTTTVTNVNGTTVVNTISTDINAQLTGLTTSGDENTLTATWDVSVTPTTPNSGTCATGLTGFVAPPPGPVTLETGDVGLTLPFALIGEAAYAFLQQLNFCKTPLNLGAFIGQVTPNGNVTVARGGPRRVDLILPATFNATSPLANGAFNFNINMHTRPAISAAGDIVLGLTTLLTTDLSGTINTTVGGAPAVYSFTSGGATVSVAGGPPTPAPNIGPALQAQMNLAIMGSGLFPMPVALRGTVYVVPHVYIEPNKVQVDTGSFSLGIEIKDGSQPTDVAVIGVEGTAPYTDARVGSPFMRTIPLNSVVWNKHDRHVAPPTDLTISVDGENQMLWIPPIAAGAVFKQPFTIQVPVNASGSVLGDTRVTISADIGETTMIDENRDNNVYTFVINNNWFQPDYTVEIGDVEMVSELQETGQTIINYYIVSTDFTIPVTMRNIGTEGGSPQSLRSLKVYVQDNFYGSAWIGGLEVGDETEHVFEIHVPDGPDNYCNYKIEVEIASNDANEANNNDFKTIHVVSSSCIGSGPNDGDLQWIQENGMDVLEDRFDGLEQEVWYTDAPSNVDTGSHPPILDRQEPLPNP